MKFWTLLALQLFTFLGLAVGVMSYAHKNDPFSYYTPPNPDADVFSTNLRYQNPALIKYFDYDTLILGTSHTQNVTPDMTAGSGWKPLNATAPGSSILHQKASLDLAVSTHGPDKIRRVILEAPIRSYIFGSEFNQRHTMPEYLYYPAPETPFNHLLSFDALSRLSGDPQKNRKTLAELHTWWPQHKRKYGPAPFAGNVAPVSCEPLRISPSLPKDGAANQLAEAVDLSLVPMIEEHSNIEFIIWFPPRTSLYSYEDTDADMQRLFLRQYIARRVGSFENVKLYDFAAWPEVANDVKQFKDVDHFGNSALAQIYAQLQDDASTFRVASKPWPGDSDPLIETIAQYDISEHAKCGGSIGVYDRNTLYDRARAAEKAYVKFRKDPGRAQMVYDDLVVKGAAHGHKRFYYRIAEAKYYGWGTPKDLEGAAEIIFGSEYDGMAAAHFLRGEILMQPASSYYDTAAAKLEYEKSASLGQKSAMRALEKLESQAGE